MTNVERLTIGRRMNQMTAQVLRSVDLGGWVRVGHVSVLVAA